MRALRVALALLLSASAVALIARVMVPRIDCNLAKGQINRSVRRLDRADEYSRAARARKNLEKCQQCLQIFPEDHQLHVLRAANLRVLGSYDEAQRTLEHALTLCERPEIYAQIAELEMERGNIEGARRALLRAAIYDISYVEMLDEPLKTEIYLAVYERKDRLQAAKQLQPSP